MAFPVNPVIFGAEIESHLIFEVLAYFIGFRYYLYLRKNTVDPISSENRLWIFIGAVTGAFFMARFLGLLENFQSLRFENLTYYLGNKTIVGGLVGGLIGVELTKKILGVKVSSGDMMAYPLILGIITGRIGCFLAGLKDNTYGTASNLPWAIDLGDGIRRHPTSLYEILFLAVLWIALKKLENKYILADGSKFKLFLASYLFFRFSVEYLKPVTPIILNLTAIQLACLAGLLYYYRLIIKPKKIIESEKVNA